MKLRPYQQQTIRELREAIKTHNRVIMCAPTGSGKTVMFSDIIHRASERGTISLVLTDRIELFGQTLRAVGENAQELSASTKTSNFDPKATVTVAMVETYNRRKLPDYEPKLIIIDEAHKGNFNKIMDKHPNALVIGATATPVGKHLYKYYTEIVSSIDIPELVESGFLSPCRAYQMQDDFQDLTVKRGEYTDESLFNHFNERKLYKGVLMEWSKRAIGRKTIVFNVNIKHTEKTHEAFLEAGINSAMITSKTPKAEREKTLSDFTDGKIQVLNNCGILTTGYDEPSIECVVVNRKTKSLPLWLQMVGRGSRIFPNKTEFILLDFGQNHDEHGLWSEPRTWKLEKPKKKKQQAAPVKDCPKCDAMNFSSARVCSVCGFVFPERTKEDQAGGVMVEVTKKVPSDLVGRRLSSLSVMELVQLQKTKRYSTPFIWRVVSNMSPQDREQYRQQMKYSKGWAYHKKKLGAQPFNDYILK